MAKLLAWLGLANTVTGLGISACDIWSRIYHAFFRNYYVGIPTELVKAARLDGAGFLSIFRHVFIPFVHANICGHIDLAIYSDLE